MAYKPDPYIEKAKKSLLIVGEGKSEKVFLKHLKRLYSCQNNTSINIKNGKGGSAEAVIRKAIKEPPEYFQKIVVVDYDRMTKAAKDLARKGSIKTIINRPCIEGLFLHIKTGNSRIHQRTPTCKREFKKEYLKNKASNFNLEKCEKIFPKEELDECCSEIPQLNKIIKAIKQGHL